MDELKTGTERISPGVLVSGKPLQAIRRCEHEGDEGQCNEQHQRQHVNQSCTCQKGHADHHADNNDRSAKVGLQEQKKSDHRQNADEAHETTPMMPHRLFLPDQVASGIKQQGQLGELRGLQGERPEGQPTLCPMHFAPDAGHEHQNQ